MTAVNTQTRAWPLQSLLVREEAEGKQASKIIQIATEAIKEAKVLVGLQEGRMARLLAPRAGFSEEGFRTGTR